MSLQARPARVRLDLDFVGSVHARTLIPCERLSMILGRVEASGQHHVIFDRHRSALPQKIQHAMRRIAVLATTLARLVLNVASTRLSLTRGGTDGTRAAGGVIEAFGQFVSGDSIAIGLILFIILVAIQFLVITKGATRISDRARECTA